MRSSLLVSPQLNHEATVIQLESSLTASTVMQFHQTLHAALLSSPQHCHLVMDMQQVEQIDCAGLMALVAAFKLAIKFNKHLFLCSVSRPVQMVLELTQLDQVFLILESSAIEESGSSVVTPSANQGRTLALMG
jgi:anti-anti-sigma factor